MITGVEMAFRWWQRCAFFMQTRFPWRERWNFGFMSPPGCLYDPGIFVGPVRRLVWTSMGDDDVPTEEPDDGPASSKKKI